MDEQAMIKELTETSARAKSNSKRIDEIKEDQETLKSLAVSVATLAEKEKTMESDVKEIKSDIKEINAKPGKRWESIIEKFLLTIVTGLVVYMMAKLGIK